jgi:hypothetical protein
LSEYGQPRSPVPEIPSNYVLKDWLSKLAHVSDVQLISSASIGFTNSWDSAGSPYANAGFYKDPFGRVWFAGAIDSGASGNAAFTLPVGFRPKGTILVPVVTLGTSPSNPHLVITSAGVVTPTGVGTTPIVSLESISFRAI